MFAGFEWCYKQFQNYFFLAQSRFAFFKILSTSAVEGAFGFVLLTFGRGLLPLILGKSFGLGGFLPDVPKPLPILYQHYHKQFLLHPLWIHLVF